MNLSAGSSLKHSLSERLTWPKELKLLARKLVLLCPRAHLLLFSQPAFIFSFSRHLVSRVHHGRDADFEDPLSRHRSWVTHLFLKISQAGRANRGSSGFRLFSFASSALDNSSTAPPWIELAIFIDPSHYWCQTWIAFSRPTFQKQKAVGVAQLAERSLPTPEICGSNPEMRNIFFVFSGDENK